MTQVIIDKLVHEMLVARQLGVIEGGIRITKIGWLNDYNFNEVKA